MTLINQGTKKEWKGSKSVDEEDSRTELTAEHNQHTQFNALLAADRGPIRIHSEDSVTGQASVLSQTLGLKEVLKDDAD
ncbi:hypothetical protein N7528_000659 [Penicillium herquei]|nr:hypothetical protein N7528_000659 [Penicillium herquei]